MWTTLAAALLTVSAATSLADVLTDLAGRYEKTTGVEVRINPGASNTLARQIAEGAPVDVFISADEAQMLVAEKSGRIARGSRVALLSNHLVVVVPANSRLVIAKPADLAGASVRRIAIGQPDSVPAGVYARQWLEKAGFWQAVQPRTVPMVNVRAALAAVREGHVDAGIVYATDARTTHDVRVAYRVPAGDAPAIVYPAAALVGPGEAEARRFLTFLQSAEARGVFEAAGFGIPPRR